MDFGLIFLAGIIGFISGLASGFFGIGGGSIRIPLLNLIGFSIIASFGINLMTLPVSSLIGAVSQRKNIDTKLGIPLIVGGSIGTVIGTRIAFSLSTSALLLAIIFLIVSIVSVLGMNLKHIAMEASQKLRASFIALFFSSLAANIITGMRGGSVGSLFVPILRVFNIEMHKAIATALFAAIFTSLVGVLLYLNQQELLIIEGLVVLTTAAIGSRIGSFYSLKTTPRWLEIGLTIIIVILAGFPLLIIILG